MNKNDYDKIIGLPNEFENYNFKENIMYNNEQLTEIRTQIFPRYIGQLTNGNSKINGDVIDMITVGAICSVIRLKYLASITDEDASGIIDIANVTGYSFDFIGEDKVEHGKSIVERLFLSDEYKVPRMNIICAVSICQHLQLKGYVLPQLVILDGKPVMITVEEQINLDIIEIIK